MSNLIEILHSVSYKLTFVEDELQVYEIMYEGVKKILPNVYFVISKLQEDDMNFRIIHNFGFERTFSTIKSLLGKDPFQMDFPFDDLSGEKLEGYKNRTLYHFKDGIYDLVNGKINKTICKAIEKILGISEVYAISYFLENKNFGGASFFVPKSANSSDNINIETKLAIENISYQASTAINALRNYKALEKKEVELRNSQLRFNQLINQMSDIVWKANGDGTELIDLNNSFEKYYGYTSSEFFKNPNLWLDVVHPEDKKIAEKASLELHKNGKTDCEYRIIRPDGRILWLHDRKSIVFNKDGKPIQIGGIASDITEKKLLEEQLRLKDYALDNSPTSIGLADIDGFIIYVNTTFLKLYGYETKNEIIGKHISDLSSEKVLPNIVLEKLKKRETFIGEVKIKQRDGNNIYCVLSASPIIQNQKFLCLMALFVDISELKQIQHKLIDNEQKLLEAQQIGNMGHWEYNFETQKLYWSDQLYKIYELSKDEFEPDLKKALAASHIDDQESIRKSYFEAIQNKLDFDLESRINTPDGEIKHIITRAKPKFDENGNPTTMIGTVVDITERKKIENELKNSQEELRKFSSYLLKVRENERAEITLEIHDSIAQFLVALKVEMGLFLKKISTGIDVVKSEDVKIKMEQLVSKVDITLKSARMIMNGLRPEQLELLGLVEATEVHLHNFEEIHHIKCNFENTVTEPIRHQEQSIVLFRILQESLTNILKHANANTVTVKLTKLGSNLMLEVIDNGVGFDEKCMFKPDSYGVISMREQVKRLNGIFKITSQIGKGTLVHVEIPMLGVS
jgi:PAS domain S-box-containing protein